MSEREQAARRIAEWINANKLNRPFGGDVNKSGDKRYYGVLFAYPRFLDGYAKVYGPKFVMLEMQGPWVHGSRQRVNWLARMNEGGSRRAVFNSVDDAIAFMRAAFIDHDWEAADRVPTKQGRAA